jgi:hypothetical protein
MAERSRGLNIFKPELSKCSETATQASAPLPAKNKTYFFSLTCKILKETLVLLYSTVKYGCCA